MKTGQLGGHPDDPRSYSWVTSWLAFSHFSPNLIIHFRVPPIDLSRQRNWRGVLNLINFQRSQEGEHRMRMVSTEKNHAWVTVAVSPSPKEPPSSCSTKVKHSVSTNRSHPPYSLKATYKVGGGCTQGTWYSCVTVIVIIIIIIIMIK